MGKVIAIANSKGGVGKTTTTINLGAAFVKYNKKVLIIDLDEKANSTIGLGIDREFVSCCSFDALLKHCGITECICPTTTDNLYIIPSKLLDFSVEEELYKIEKNKIVLSLLLDEIRESYDYILIDCHPQFGIINENALYASDSIIIPCDCEYYSFEALTQMINKINQVQKQKKKKRLNLLIEGILLTKLDNRNLFGYKMVDKIKAMFPLKTFKTIITVSSHLKQAPMAGKNILEYAYHSRGSKEYRELAKEILSKVESQN